MRGRRPTCPAPAVAHCRRRMRIRVVKAKMTATVTVIRSRFFSTTVDPAAAGADRAAEHVGEAAALAAVHEDQEDERQGRQDLQDDDDCGQHADLLSLARDRWRRYQTQRPAARRGPDDAGEGRPRPGWPRPPGRRRHRAAPPAPRCSPALTEPPYWIRSWLGRLGVRPLGRHDPRIHGAGVLGVLGGGRCARADGPDRLVGDDHAGHGSAGTPVQGGVDLAGQRVLGHARLALLDRSPPRSRWGSWRCAGRPAAWRPRPRRSRRRTGAARSGRRSRSDSSRASMAGSPRR